MGTAFVTGATGFLGRHLIDVLCEEGWTVTALVRNPAAAEKILPESVILRCGDIRDKKSIMDALSDHTDAVFHCAASTSTWRRENQSQEDINVSGTKNILSAAQISGVKRFIHVSSIAVYGIHHSEIREETPQKGENSWVGYVRSKSLAEKAVKQAAAQGLDIVIVNPTHILGVYDTHNWARLVRLIDAENLPGVPPGSGNFANGRKVAEAMVRAYKSGRKGENYILSGPKASLFDFVTLAGGMLGRKTPGKPTPGFILKTVSRLLDLWSSLTRKRPLITPEDAYFSCEEITANSAKAMRELGYEEVPLTDSLKETITYLQDQKLISTGSDDKDLSLKNLR